MSRLLQLIKSCLAQRDFVSGKRFVGLRLTHSDDPKAELQELHGICAEAAEGTVAYSAESMAALIGVGDDGLPAIATGAVEVTIRGARGATKADLLRFVDEYDHYPHTLRLGPEEGEASLTFTSAEEAARAVDELSGKAVLGEDVELEAPEADEPEEGEAQDE